MSALASLVQTYLVPDLRCLLLLVVTFLVSLRFLDWHRWYKVLPPGPRGLPIVGVLPFIKQEFHLYLFGLSRHHGKIISLKMGGETIVVLSDPALIKKAFGSRDFVARPKSELSGILNGYGVINSEGELWNSQRRFLINQKLGMRHWGSGMGQIENCVQRESHALLRTIVSEHGDGKPFNPSGLLNVSIANVICSMIMSTRFRKDDPKFNRFIDLFDEGFKLFADTGAVTFLPFLRFLPGVRSACQQLKANRAEMLDFARTIIDEHKERLDPDAPRDLIDSYLVTIEELKAADKTHTLFHGYDADEQLAQIVLDLFSAGVETLKTSMLWAILYMLHNPEVLRKVQAEMDRVIGNERLPQFADWDTLPYTRAVLCESMRRASVVPMGTTHATDKVTHFEGHTLPKNTHVIPLLHAVHMNPESWPEPEKFRPERFLSEDGTEVRRPDNFMPFGAGRRMCLGDTLAEKEFFLFFTTFFHALDVRAAGGAPPDLAGVAGVTVCPRSYEIVCQPRKEMRDSLVSALVLEEQSGALPCRTYG